MKKLIILFTSILLVSCGGKSPESKQADKAQKELDSISKSLTQEIEDISNNILKDDIDYTKTDCAYWVETKTDAVTGKTKTKAKETIVFGKTLIEGKRYKLGKNNIELSLRLDKNDVVFQFHIVGFGACADDKDKINILFNDNTRLELRNEADYNCDGIIAVWLPKNSKKLKELMSKTIKTIRPTMNNEYIDIECIENSSTHLNNAIKCLTETK
jgi:hypothetical protein